MKKRYESISITVKCVMVDMIQVSDELNIGEWDDQNEINNKN